MLGKQSSTKLPVEKDYLEITKKLDDIQLRYGPPPTSFTVDVWNLDHQKVGEITLPPAIFGVPVRTDIIHRVIHWQRCNRRVGLARAKTRGEVKGSTKKLYPQKGSGRARVGDSRSPTRIGGGVAFPPRGPKNWKYRLNPKVRKLGLKCTLASKFAHNELIVLEDLKLEQHKTKILHQKLAQFNLHNKNSLIVTNAPCDTNFARAHQNLPYITVLPSQYISPFEILRKDYLIITKDVIPFIEQKTSSV